MSNLLSIGAGNYTGAITIPQATIPNGLTAIGASAECAGWTDTSSSMLIDYQFSTDGGVTWGMDGSCEFNGGATHLGQPLSNLVFEIGVPPGSGVKIQGSITIVGTFVTQAIEVTGTP